MRRRRIKIIENELNKNFRNNFLTAAELKKILAKRGYSLSRKSISKLGEQTGTKYFYKKLKITLYSKKILNYFKV